MTENSKPHPDDEFYLWIGKCIKRWAYVERHLFGICCTVLGMSEPSSRRRLAAVIYFRTPTLEAKLSLVSDLLHAAAFPEGKRSGQHDPQAVKDWKKVQEAIRALLPERNFIAHNPMRHELFAFRDGKRVPIPKGEAFVYQDWDDKARRPSAIERMGTKELKAHDAALGPVMAGLLTAWKSIEELLKERA